MRQPWISFREPRSQIQLAQLSNDSHPANGPIPFCIGKPRLLYFPFLSPPSPVRVPGPAFVIQLYNKPNAWISFTDSNVAGFALS